MKKAALHNLGCKVNAYETEAMQQMLSDAGYEIVPFTQKADVYVVNTCSVTNMADKKSRQMLHRAKKMNREAVVAAVGCYVQTAEKILENDPSVDLIIGNNKKKDLAAILERFFKEREKTKDITDMTAAQEYEELHIRRIADHTRAFLKVQDGCNQFCSYCIIPYTRGRVRSRDMEDIVKEVETLAGNGYREIVLTGIHLSSYGVDFQEGEVFKDGAKNNLLSLIVRLDAVEGIERLRLGSLEPRIVTEEFAQTLSSLRTICPHFHLSLQSGCKETLNRMNRRYTPEEYLEGCRILRKHFENPAITTDVIVGFPGETNEEYGITKEFLKAVRFYEMHIFKYSVRQGTKAASMEAQVPEPVKNERSEDLLLLDAALSLEYRKSFLDKQVQVLLEERADIGGAAYMMGHTREYVKAAVPFCEGLKNKTVSGRLTGMLTDEILFLEKES